MRAFAMAQNTSAFHKQAAWHCHQITPMGCHEQVPRHWHGIAPWRFHHDGMFHLALPRWFVVLPWHQRQCHLALSCYLKTCPGTPMATAHDMAMEHHELPQGDAMARTREVMMPTWALAGQCHGNGLYGPRQTRDWTWLVIGMSSLSGLPGNVMGTSTTGSINHGSLSRRTVKNVMRNHGSTIKAHENQ